MNQPAVRSDLECLAIVESIGRAKLAIAAMPQIAPPPTEHFLSNAGKSNGVYGRSMRLKAGEIIVGKIHKFEQLNILAEGEALVRSIDGDVRIKAPHIFVGSFGAERVIYAVTDLLWVTAHAIGEMTNIEEIEDHLVTENRLKIAMGAK